MLRLDVVKGRMTKASNHQMNTPVPMRGSRILRQRPCMAMSTAPPSFKTPPSPSAHAFSPAYTKYMYTLCVHVLYVSISYEVPGTNSLPHLGTFIPIFGLANLPQPKLLDRLHVSGGPDQATRKVHLLRSGCRQTDRHHQHWRGGAPRATSSDY